MFLTYAVDSQGELIHIENAPRGKAPDLHCPYCHGLLIARKGHIKAHHFAHAGETCRAVIRDDDAIALPAYERFDLSLWGPDWQALPAFHQTHVLPQRRLFERLVGRGLIRYDRKANRHTLTEKGGIPFGETALADFATVQDALIAEKHDMLERRAAGEFAADAERELYRNDLRLFRAQLGRVHSASLYFLAIQHSGGTLYKVGVTTRDIQERIGEIQRDLDAHLGAVTITPLHNLANRGTVELYFKHRYKAANTPMGTLTEYFTFAGCNPVNDALTQLGNRALSAFDRALLAGEPARHDRPT
jgi:hypothetical protein